MQTRIITCDDLSYAVEVFLRGGLVGLPTDTVYGLAGNALDAEAVSKLYEVKGRPSVKPFILLLSDIEVAESVCEYIPESARKLAKAFWPGPLSFVLQKHKNVPEIVSAGGETIGIRCPGHPKALEFLRLAGIPAAAPSANISDMPPPKNVDEVLAYFDGLIECVIDGGECEFGVSSTIIDLTSEPYKILRQGALAEEEIRRVLNA